MLNTSLYSKASLDLFNVCITLKESKFTQRLMIEDKKQRKSYLPSFLELDFWSVKVCIVVTQQEVTLSNTNTLKY